MAAAHAWLLTESSSQVHIHLCLLCGRRTPFEETAVRRQIWQSLTISSADHHIGISVLSRGWVNLGVAQNISKHCRHCCFISIPSWVILQRCRTCSFYTRLTHSIWNIFLVHQWSNASKLVNVSKMKLPGFFPAKQNKMYSSLGDPQLDLGPISLLGLAEINWKGVSTSKIFWGLKLHRHAKPTVTGWPNDYW